MDLTALLARAERAFRDTPLEAVQNRYRAVVGPTSTQIAAVRAAMDKLRVGQRPSLEEVVALEAAIRLFRPSIPSVRGALGPLAVEVAPTFPLWPEFAARFSSRAYAVGRIDLVEGADRGDRSVGTGFLVRPRVLVTNRHVVRELERGGEGVAPGAARVRFGQEQRTVPDRAPVAILRVIVEHDTLDLALLELDTPADEVTPLPLSATAAAPGQPVATIGYPGRDDLRNPLFARVVFNGVYETKQAAPGEVIAVRGPVLHHDCSTLGGNSGSPVVSLPEGEVLAVHFSGSYLVRNEAVVASALGDFLGASGL